MSGWDNARKRGEPGPFDRASHRAEKQYRGMVERDNPEPTPKSGGRPRRGGMKGQWNKRMYGA